jgi:hypothetical protein
MNDFDRPFITSAEGPLSLLDNNADSMRQQLQLDSVVEGKFLHFLREYSEDNAFVYR